MKELDEGIWWWEGERPGPKIGVSFGVHGNERSPIEAGLSLLQSLTAGDLTIQAGGLLLIHANLRASAADQRWSDEGVDLNRCFHRDILARAPALYEEERAGRIASAIEETGIEALVDFHCTVEPGQRFLMQHPAATDAAHAQVYRLLRAEVLLADPNLNFGSVSLDEYMSTRERVGICYETGWIQDPENTPEFVREEMENVLRGHGLIAGQTKEYTGKSLLQLDDTILCQGPGYQWEPNMGDNLQHLPAGTQLGRYADGSTVVLERDSTLIFPKKRPELVQVGKPLVLLATKLEA